jgi:hypothetical protein
MDDMVVQQMGSEFLKYSNQEKLRLVDTVSAKVFKTHRTVVDSFTVDLFIRNPADTLKAVKSKSGFILNYRKSDQSWLHSDSLFNSKGQLEWNVLSYNENDVASRKKYTYKHKDTVSVTTYFSKGNTILEQSLFERKKDLVKKTTYNYYNCKKVNVIKIDKTKRIVYTEDCDCGNPYFIAKYYTYSDTTLTVKTELGMYFEEKSITDIYRYNSSGLIESKKSESVINESVTNPTYIYDLVKFFYK